MKIKTANLAPFFFLITTVRARHVKSHLTPSSQYRRERPSEENLFSAGETGNNTNIAAIDTSTSLTNQIICGYQGWFTFPGDGAPINRWKHWFNVPSNVITPGLDDLVVDMYPTTDEYDEDDMKETGIIYRNGNGTLPTSYAKFFSSAKPKVVMKHFEWMETYGISGVFHMRFMQDIFRPNNRATQTMVLRNVKNAAEATGRVFAMSYNIAGTNDDVLDDLKDDWKKLVDDENITQSSRYMHENGLPVLRIYGIGFKAVNVSDTDKIASLIDWFQYSAEDKYRVFLMGGVPSRWRDRVVDSREEPVWADIYDSLNSIQPWHVGRWTNIIGFNRYLSDIISNDARYCISRGILYMPTMWPGFSWHNLKNGQPPVNDIPRLGGDFMWKQAYGYVANPNISTIWMAQFDEVDESTAIFKVTARTSDLPSEGSWLALDADGQSLPSDWYLRLAGEAQKMLEGARELNSTIPIHPNDPAKPNQTSRPTTANPTTAQPTAAQRTTANPTTANPTTAQPTTANPTPTPVTDSPMKQPTPKPVTDSPTRQLTSKPVTDSPSKQPTPTPVTDRPTSSPTNAPNDTPPPTRSPTESPFSNPAKQPTPKLQPTLSPAKNPLNTANPTPKRKKRKKGSKYSSGNKNGTKQGKAVDQSNGKSGKQRSGRKRKTPFERD